jgi:hypothetical protein
MALTKATNFFISGAFANVLDYGADPTGATDSTAAFNAAKATGNRVFVPEGTYAVANILMDQDGQSFVGAGRDITILTTQGTNCGFQINGRMCEISNMTMIAANTADCIRLGTRGTAPLANDSVFPQQATFQNMRFVGALNGIFAYGTNKGRFITCFFEACVYGVHFAPVGSPAGLNGNCNGNTFTGCDAFGCVTSMYLEPNLDGGNASSDNFIDFVSEATTDKSFVIVGTRNYLFLLSDSDAMTWDIPSVLVSPNINGGANFFIARNPDNRVIQYGNTVAFNTSGGVAKMNFPFIQKPDSYQVDYSVATDEAINTAFVAGFASDEIFVVRNTTSPNALVGIVMNFFQDVPVGFKITFFNNIATTGTAGFLFKVPTSGGGPWTTIGWTTGDNLLGFAAFPSVTFVKIAAATILKL